MRTTRERVTALTSAAPCAACHDIINPAGFAFEHYDASGALRADERGFPIDARGSLTVEGKRLSFDGAVDLTRQLAGADATRRCYAAHWLLFAYGRAEADGDRCTIERAGAVLAAGGGARDMLLELTQARAFLNHVVRR